MRLPLVGADLRPGVVALDLVGLIAGRGGMNAGRPRLAAGFEFEGMRF